MADQMTPAELRAAAERHYHCQSSERDVDVLIEAARLLADVIEWATHYTPARGYTLYEDQREELLRIARGETNEEARNHE